jgi:membrane associated rhomboid family serine protease
MAGYGVYGVPLFLGPRYHFGSSNLFLCCGVQVPPTVFFFFGIWFFWPSFVQKPNKSCVVFLYTV